MDLIIMKKYLLMLALLIASQPVLADWSKMLEGKSSVTYIDQSSISKVGNLVRINSITDYTVAQDMAGVKYLSILAVTEYDCQGKQFHSIDLKWFGASMAQGEVVLHNDVQDDWQAVNPATGREAIWEIVCD
jgi:hypothetical protein